MSGWRCLGGREVQRITLHECRHTLASSMIAAGFNAKAVTSYIGRSSVDITFGRYGHLMPVAKTAGLLDADLTKATA